MKKLVKIFVAVVVLSCMSTFTYAQDNNKDAHDITITIHEVALLDIEPSGSNTITIGPAAPIEAGEPIDFTSATNNTLWMNYSSIIGSSTEPSRDVTVAITNGTVPGGMALTVVAAADAGNGAGTVGIPTAAVTLSATAQNIVTGVKSCYTGTGTSNGHNLTYTLSLTAPADYGDLDFDDATTLTVTYTISNN
jgi:hypothetical protein